MVCCVAKTPRQAGARCVADHRPAKDVLAEKAREREEAARQKNKKEEEADRRIHQAAVAAAAAAAHVKEAEASYFRLAPSAPLATFSYCAVSLAASSPLSPPSSAPPVSARWFPFFTPALH